MHDELIKSLSRGVDAFGEALRQKDFEIDDLMRKNKELEELVAAAEKAKALEMVCVALDMVCVALEMVCVVYGGKGAFVLCSLNVLCFLNLCCAP